MENMTQTPLRTIDRAPVVGDIVILTPRSSRLFDVLALDEPGVPMPMIYAGPHDPEDESPAQWYFTTYVKVVDDENPNAWA